MATAVRITSRQHPVVQRCRLVAARRVDDDQILLDGDHLLADALAAGVSIDLVVTAGPAPAAVSAAAARGAVVYDATPAVLDAISPVRTPSGVVAVGRWAPAPLPTIFPGAGLVVGLVAVQDPGNVGAVIRAADALGATSVATLDQSADPAGWKVLRGAMGSAFRLPVARGTSADAIALARSRGLTVVAAAAAGGTPLDRIDWTRPTLLLLGHEGGGLGDLARTADDRVTIPMRAGVESLNVATAAALLAYEARRQRDRA